MKRIATRFLSLGGVIGSILFTSITIICASLQADYDHLDNFISELGATGASTELIMNYLGFIPSGICFSLFALSLLIAVSKGWVSRTGSVLFMVFGIGMSLAGIFSCDAGCPPVGSMESGIHDGVSAIAFMSAILGIILLGFSFKKIKGLHSIWLYSLITGLVALILMLVMISTFESKHLTGLWQRLFLFSVFLWTIIAGLKIYKNHGANEGPNNSRF
ncbi:DUF998 domain-containing protein [Gramella jeungdoensis]|uniref:DUF998 domain-containing protein n=1 Tax=Gramella jeungdoensis TaxID=708091 RepID=A0ABT0Z097_9FLAO|nr:DUF998 domain-containing protein [Gramella jeungdoensis]MCM8568587.1 DUF998 domain-containing protein [Gramella jeungdoensis]